MTIQIIASVFATLWLMAVFPKAVEKSATSVAESVVLIPSSDANLARSFFMELTLTFILM